MSCLSWNCRGLGNPTTVQVLVDLVHSKKPNIIFLIETFVNMRKLQPIKSRLGYLGLFSVDSIGHRGGLALLWKEGTEVDIKSFSVNHIDAEVSLSTGDSKWRFTGFYGCPERARRSQSWNLLKCLAGRSSLPWAVLGDFNDILFPDEKRGGNPQPRGLIEGFSEAVEASGLRDFKFEGHQFTWERSKGTPNWVEAKLDRVLTSDEWSDLFPLAKASSVIVSKSDHLPLFLEIHPTTPIRQKARFRFENLWLRDSTSRDIMIESWSMSGGLHLIDRMERCSKAIWNWGKSFAKDFDKRLSYWRKRMESTKSRRDLMGISTFQEAQAQYIRALHHQNDYWRQRAKQFWLREGDTNSAYFHNSVRRRRQNNRISKLKDEDGNWVERGYLRDAKVENLLNIERTDWDAELLNDIFEQEDVSLIKSIPITDCHHRDKLIWKEDEKGVYTVKSCYGKLQNPLHNQQPLYWTSMWRMKLPPKIKSFFWQLCSNSLPTVDNILAKHVPISPICQLCACADENSFHLFVGCSVARQCWDLLGNSAYRNCYDFHEWLEGQFKSLHSDQLCLVISVCWKIWEARNEKVWNQIVLQAHTIVRTAQTFLHEWAEVNFGKEKPHTMVDNVVRWSKPPLGLKKLNVDAALDSTHKKMGFGFVLRDEDGRFVAARQLPWFSMFKSDEAEAMGVKEALKWLKELNVDGVVVESDALKVINGVHECSDVTSFDLIISDIRSLATDFVNLSFSFAKRSANRVAHFLAREALSKSDREDCFTVPFPSLVHVLELDSI